MIPCDEASHDISRAPQRVRVVELTNAQVRPLHIRKPKLLELSDIERPKALTSRIVYSVFHLSSCQTCHSDCASADKQVLVTSLQIASAVAPKSMTASSSTRTYIATSMFPTGDETEMDIFTRCAEPLMQMSCCARGTPRAVSTCRCAIDAASI